MRASSERKRQAWEVAFYAILFLFFLQLISDFVEAIYAFGLLGTSLPPEVVSVLLLFSPALLLLFRRRMPRELLVAVGTLMLLCRAVEPALGTRGRMLVAGLGTACFLVFFPAWLAGPGGSARRQPALPGPAAARGEGEDGLDLGHALGIGLALSIVTSILWRVAGSGVDVSTVGSGQAIGWILAAVAGLLLIRFPDPRPGPVAGAGTGREEDHPSLWRTAGLCVGAMGVLVLIYFAIGSPNVIARWTGANYLVITAAIILLLTVYAVFMSFSGFARTIRSKPMVIALNLSFVTALVLTLLVHQIRFPAGPGAYPLPEPPASPWQHVPLIITLVLFPVLLLDFEIFLRELTDRHISYRYIGFGFFLASLYLLLIIFAQIFTTVYDYIPVVGPLFRDRFWLVFGIAGLVTMLPLFLAGRRAFGGRLLPREPVLPAGVLLLGMAVVALAWITAARPPTPPTDETRLRILTYNVQQGYSEHGLKNYEQQLDLIREVDPDIIGLQECDTNRIANGNSDLVRYLADRLEMYSYYGPKTVVGTFGIALLSRYPIQAPRTFYMYSEGEQTATIEAHITAEGRTFRLYVTHLGNGGPMIQQEAILKEVKGKENVVLLGDFNFRPDSEQYRLTTGTLVDSWLLRWPAGVDDQGQTLDNRIDHIFLSPGMTVADSRYLVGPQSDHPALVTTLEW